MITTADLTAQDVKTFSLNDLQSTRIDWDHLAKVMTARKAKNLPYSLVVFVFERNFNAKILANPITKKPIFAIIY